MSVVVDDRQAGLEEVIGLVAKLEANITDLSRDINTVSQALESITMSLGGIFERQARMEILLRTICGCERTLIVDTITYNAREYGISIFKRPRAILVFNKQIQSEELTVYERRFVYSDIETSKLHKMFWDNASLSMIPVKVFVEDFEGPSEVKFSVPQESDDE